jgi:hypothetical protein
VARGCGGYEGMQKPADGGVFESRKVRLAVGIEWSYGGILFRARLTLGQAILSSWEGEGTRRWVGFSHMLREGAKRRTAHPTIRAAHVKGANF